MKRRITRRGATLLLAACVASSISPSPAVAAEVTPDVTVAAVGDMMFDSAPGRLVASSGPNAPFSAVASRLRSADVAVGNLECALSNRGAPVAGKTFTFEGSPRAASGLKWAGFDLIGQANNHARDYGSTALLDTIRALDVQGLAHAGAGKNRAAAWTPAIITRNGATIAYLAFSQITPTNFAATSSSPGTAWGTSRSQVVAAIRAAHKKADYVIVSFHWGIEREYSPTSTQVSFGHSAVDAGADLVLSHHPHVIQGVEYYKKGAIAYSLGNFVFSPGSAAGHDTMIVYATMTPDGVTGIRAEPVYIGSGGKPAPATGSNASRIRGIIRRTSAGRGTLVSTKDGLVHLKSRVPFVRTVVASDEPKTTAEWACGSVARIAFGR